MQRTRMNDLRKIVIGVVIGAFGMIAFSWVQPHLESMLGRGKHLETTVIHVPYESHSQIFRAFLNETLLSELKSVREHISQYRIDFSPLDNDLPFELNDSIFSSIASVNKDLKSFTQEIDYSIFQIEQKILSKNLDFFYESISSFYNITIENTGSELITDVFISLDNIKYYSVGNNNVEELKGDRIDVGGIRQGESLEVFVWSNSSVSGILPDDIVVGYSTGVSSISHSAIVWGLLSWVHYNDHWIPLYLFCASIIVLFLYTLFIRRTRNSEKSESEEPQSVSSSLSGSDGAVKEAKQTAQSNQTTLSETSIG